MYSKLKQNYVPKKKRKYTFFSLCDESIAKKSDDRVRSSKVHLQRHGVGQLLKDAAMACVAVGVANARSRCKKLR